MHGTNVPEAGRLTIFGQEYERKSAFPDERESRRYALRLLLGFRRLNWRFDLIGGGLYVMLVWSVTPLCSLYNDIIGEGQSLAGVSDWSAVLGRFTSKVIEVHIEILLNSYVSCAVFFLLGVICFSLADSSLKPWKRFTLGLVHLLAHSVTAVTLLTFSELCISSMIELGLFAHVDWSKKYSEGRFTPLFTTALDPYTGGLSSSLVKALTAFADVPEWATKIRAEICASPHGIASLSRVKHLAFFAASASFFFLVAAPAVCAVFGIYLLTCNLAFKIAWDESFSALRSDRFKSFLRMHIKSDGSLEVFCVGVERVHKHWTRNAKLSPASPSKWVPKPAPLAERLWTTATEEAYQPKIVDHVVIPASTTSKKGRRVSF